MDTRLIKPVIGQSLWIRLLHHITQKLQHFCIKFFKTPQKFIIIFSLWKKKNIPFFFFFFFVKLNVSEKIGNFLGLWKKLESVGYWKSVKNEVEVLFFSWEKIYRGSAFCSFVRRKSHGIGWDVFCAENHSRGKHPRHLNPVFLNPPNNFNCSSCHLQFVD